MLSLLHKKPGRFIFLDESYNTVTFTDYDEVPDDLVIKEIITFLPEIPPPPHTVQQHEEIHLWDLEFKRLLEKTYATSNTRG